MHSEVLAQVSLSACFPFQIYHPSSLFSNNSGIQSMDISVQTYVSTSPSKDLYHEDEHIL